MRPAVQAAPRILIVEDNYIVAVELEIGLTDAGFEVVGIADSAAAALQLAIEERPALAIMDVRLRGNRDGVDAALEIFQHTGVRCIFATAHQEVEMQARAQHAAPLGWICKPYQIDSMVAMIRRALGDPDKKQ